MIRVREAIVVEGRYDANALRQLVDAPILETAGFGIFNNKEQLQLLRTAAERRGLIILTDSDGAGFMIRHYLSGAIDPKLVKHAYVPDVYGKEKRKSAPSKEGKLGVEGMAPEVLLEALRRAGKEGLELSCVCALANTGKKELWIQLAGEEPLAERLRLEAGQVWLPPLETRINAEDFGPEAAKVQLLFTGETEAGERVCEAEAAIAPLQLAANSETETSAPLLTIEQELIAPEGSGYRVGETVQYAIHVINEGMEPLTQVTIRDLAGVEAWTLENLQPGEARTVTRKYAVTKQDAIAGYLCWTAQAGLPEDKTGQTAQSNPLIVSIRVDE
mgnify:CR=1 FL=1